MIKLHLTCVHSPKIYMMNIQALSWLFEAMRSCCNLKKRLTRSLWVVNTVDGGLMEEYKNIVPLISSIDPAIHGAGVDKEL